MYEFWDYYRTLEEDLIHFNRYVEIDRVNYKTYSMELAKMLLTAGTELDTVLKALCERIKPSCGANTIGDYYKIVISKYPDVVNHEKYVKGHRIVLKPFENWSLNKNPDWWTNGYNKIKHDRANYIQNASLENILNIVSALQMILFLYYNETYGEIGTFGILEFPRLIVPHDPNNPEKEGFVHSINFKEHY